VPNSISASCLVLALSLTEYCSSGRTVQSRCLGFPAANNEAHAGMQMAWYVAVHESRRTVEFIGRVPLPSFVRRLDHRRGRGRRIDPNSTSSMLPCAVDARADASYYVGRAAGQLLRKMHGTTHYTSYWRWLAHRSISINR
jgi:hypothetical protein